MRFFGSVEKTPEAPSGPSPTIMILSALTAAYLSVAVYHAALYALDNGETPLWAVFAAALAILGVASQIRWNGGLVLVLGASFVAQLVWAGWVDPQPLGDLGAFWIEARSVAANLRAGEMEQTLLELHQSSQPSATFIYGLSVFAFGEELSTLRALTAAVWVVQTWLVWRIASEVSELKSRAFACALVFGLSPTLIVFGGLPSVEALYGLFALAAFYVMLSHRRRGLWQSAWLGGTLVALAYLAQPAGIGYLVGLIGVLVAGFAAAGGPIQRGRMATALIACLFGFGIGVAPQAALNYAVEDRVSIAPGAAIGVGLLRGSDPDGVSQAALDSARPEIVAAAESSGARFRSAAELRQYDLIAREIAFERIAADPLGFVTYASGEKMRQLWSSEQSVLEWSFKTPNAEQNPLLSTGLGRLAPSIIGGAYLALLVAAAAGALRLVLRRGAVRDPTRWVLFYMAFLSIATAFAFVEVKERRHLAFTPLLAMLAPLPFARLPQVEDRSFRARLAAAAAEMDRRERQAGAGDQDHGEDVDPLAHPPLAAPPRPASRPAPEPVAAPAAAARPALARTPMAPRKPDPAKPASRAPTPARATPTPPPPPGESPADWSAQQKLAHVLRSMSKPPRPKSDDGSDGGPVGESA